MEITDNISLVKKKTTTAGGGEFIYKDGKNTIVIPREHPTWDKWNSIYTTIMHAPKHKRALLFDTMSLPGFPSDGTSSDDGRTLITKEEPSDEEKILEALDKLMNFFSEFQFEPNFRFVNSLALSKSPVEYIKSYFELSNNSYINEVTEKMKSAEFKQIIKDFKRAKPTSKINKRLKIYYGSAGTGKTTLAQKECENRCIVCNASMLPADLMEDFVFVEGKPSFTPSVLWECMTAGKPIVLDEINLLPFDSLRFLQGILDGKSEFDYKGHKVVIAEGFQVIGTMNLSIGGMVFGLPEPLVDRCSEMQKFTLTARQLMSALE